MTARQALVRQIVEIVRDDSYPSPFSDKRKKSVAAKLRKVYQRWAHERGCRSKIKVKAMYEGATGMIDRYPPSSYNIEEIDEHDEGEERGIGIWIIPDRVQIDIMDKEDATVARSLGKTIEARGIKVGYATKEEIRAWGQAYLEASRELDIH